MTAQQLLDAADQVRAVVLGEPLRTATRVPPARVYRVQTAAGRRALLAKIGAELDRIDMGDGQ